jgi:hypothetical protein
MIVSQDGLGAMGAVWLSVGEDIGHFKCDCLRKILEILVTLPSPMQ